jgi:folate-binding protein YgfZ
MNQEFSLNNEILEFFRNKGINIGENGGLNSVKYFSDVYDELFSLYNGVGIRINRESKLLELTGKDVLDFLHRITTNSIVHLMKNELTKTIFTSEKGRIIAIADVFNFGENQWLKTEPYFKDRIIAWINRYIINDDVSISDISDNFTIIEIFGSQKKSFIYWLFNEQNLSITRNSLNKINQNDSEIIISYAEFSAESSFNLIVQNDNVLKLLNFIFDNKGPFDFNFIGQSAFESFRIEQGILKPDYEINDKFNPHELDLTYLIDSKKGCYIGQEVIARLETYDKVQKKITGLEFSGDFEMNDKNEIYDSYDEIAGYLTSKTYSYKLKRYIGLGVIRKKYLFSDTKLFLKLNDNRVIEVKLNNLPFIKAPR